MRTLAMLTLLMSGLPLLVSEELAQPEGLQARVTRAVAQDLGINPQDGSAQFAMQILASELQLPVQARLHVSAVHAVAEDGAWLLRVECGSRLECLPFEVVLRTRSRGAPGLLESHATASSTALGSRLAAPLVRAGQRVQLAEEISGMHLSAPALCLQAGSMGERIRVRNVSSGRVVLARVRGAGKVSVEE